MGLGGFVNEGREYLTILSGSDRTPAPWINVISNPFFGFHVSTDGSGFTWAENSQAEPDHAMVERSRWRPPGEVIYVRDEETGEVWGRPPFRSAIKPQPTRCVTDRATANSNTPRMVLR